MVVMQEYMLDTVQGLCGYHTRDIVAIKRVYVVVIIGVIYVVIIQEIVSGYHTGIYIVVIMRGLSYGIYILVIIQGILSGYHTECM